MDGKNPQRVWVCTFPDTACLGDDSSTSACNWAVSWFWRSMAACPSRFASAALSLSIIRVWSAMASLSKIARRVAASILAMSANDSNTYRSASSNQRGRGAGVAGCMTKHGRDGVHTESRTRTGKGLGPLLRFLRCPFIKGGSHSGGCFPGLKRAPRHTKQTQVCTRSTHGNGS